VKGREQISSWLILFRAGNSVTAIFGVILGAILATRGIPRGDPALITILHSTSVMTFMFSWNALNDYMDIEIDKINRPDRPIPSGKISQRSALNGVFLSGGVSIASLLFAAFVSSRGEVGVYGWLPALAIWLLALVLLFNYESKSRFSLRMKDKGLPGNLAISLSVGLIIIFGAAGVYDPMDERAWSVFIIGLLYNLSREIVKDVEDLDGDKGRNTYAMRVGPEKARVIASLILTVTLVCLLAPFLFGIFIDWHLLFIIPSVVTLMSVKPKLVVEDDFAAQQMIKRSMQLCLIAFFGISLMPD
tara:strand:- start:1145 stop:2053 length:909 start_codon:yes stop_codon:yes gene_type:complete